MPATSSWPRPVAFTAATTRGSSQAFTEVRSITLSPGTAAATSGSIGPHISGATFVAITGTPSTWQALARPTRFALRSAVRMSRTPDSRPTW